MKRIRGMFLSPALIPYLKKIKNLQKTSFVLPAIVSVSPNNKCSANPCQCLLSFCVAALTTAFLYLSPLSLERAVNSCQDLIAILIPASQ